MDFVKDSVFNSKFPFEGELLDSKTYFKEYSKLLPPLELCTNDKCDPLEKHGCGDKCSNNKFYTDVLNISPEQLKELQERTDINLLNCEGEVEPVTHDFYTKFDEKSFKSKQNTQREEEAASSLVSVKNRLEMNNMPKIELPRAYFKYYNYQWCLFNEKSNNKNFDYNCDDFSNVVFCVKVYHPFLSTRTNSLKIKLLQEIHILGESMLSELKDKIVCSLDYIGDNDVSADYFLKDVKVNVTAREEYPSSFIFIENTFYNDTRMPDFVDLSKPIRDWGSDRDLGPFECKSMEKTKMSDIKLKIGRPYVFQHQGNCEHVVLFSDVRFLDSKDPNKYTSYPRTHCTGKIFCKHCMMCGDSYARWLVVGSERLTHDKTYLCQKCFCSYNYIDGKKVGNFEAYKYVDPVALL